MEKSDAKKAKSFRSLAYDPTTIQSLYKDAKARNEKIAKELPDHINSEELDLVELKPFRVEASDLDFQKRLVEKLEPRPRRRLARIAAFDPEEANIIMGRARGDKEFLAGTYDRGGAKDVGGVASFDQNQLMKGINRAIKAVNKATGSKEKEKNDSADQR